MPKRAADEEDVEYRPGLEELKRKNKRAKRKYSFLDIEAEEDDAEDDEDEGFVEGLLADDDDFEFDTERAHAKAQRLQRRKELADDPREFLRQLEQRYHVDRDSLDGDEDYIPEARPDMAGIEINQFLPTFRDPRLYMVKVRKPRKERMAVYTLLQKHLNFQRKGMNLGISSAVIPEHLRGRVYVEARTSAAVEDAIQGLELFNLRHGVKAVRIEEMPDVLKTAKKVNKLRPSDWVRVTDGEYKGDLAQVVDIVETNRMKCTLRLIPRLDIQRERSLMHEFDDELDDNAGENAPRTDFQLGVRKRGRPPQKLFNKEEIYRLTSAADMHAVKDPYTGEIFDVWNRNHFRFGLIYLDKPINKLIKGKDVQPQLEEIEKWITAEKAMKKLYERDPLAMTEGEAKRGLEIKISDATSSGTVGLFKNDRVRVIKGEQKGLTGVIEDLEGDDVIMSSEDLPIPLRVKRSQVTKTFNEGEHVKVAAGKYAGESGAIVNVDGEFVTIFTDSTRREIRVLAAHVGDSLDITTGNASKMSQRGKVHFATFDLVELVHDNSKGVVVQVMNDSVAVLHTSNVVKNVPFTAIKAKLTDRWARSHDSRGNPIAQNDAIRVTSGPSKHRQGVVLHVSGSSVFFRAQDEVNDACGVIACLASSVDASQATAQKRKDLSGYPSPALIPKHSLSALGVGGITDPRQPYRGYHSPVNLKDPYFRKQVKVIKGQWKGYTGIIVFADSKRVRVELPAKMKTVTVDRNKVKFLGDNLQMQNNQTTNEPTAEDGENGNEKSTENEGLKSKSQKWTFGSRTPRDNNYMQSTDTQSVYRKFQTPVPTASEGFNVTPYSFGEDAFGEQTRHHSEVPVANPYNAQYPDTGANTKPVDTDAKLGSNSISAIGALSTSTEKKSAATHLSAPIKSDLITEPNVSRNPRDEPNTPTPTLEPKTPLATELLEPKTPNAEFLDPVEAVAGYKVLVNVVVSIASEDNNLAVVRSATVDGTSIFVTMLTGPDKGAERLIGGENLTPMQPSTEINDPNHPELVKVLDGEHKGRIAALIEVQGDSEDPDGVVQFVRDSDERVVLSLSLVAKCQME